MLNLTIANLKHMIKHYEGSNRPKDKALLADAKAELAKRERLLKMVQNG